jgi:uncharacterized protein
MSTVSLATAVAVRRARVHRLIRKLHVWIGAWGAIAAVLFGITGFLQNHRAVMKLPQGDSTEVGSVELPVPEEARGSLDALRVWLQNTQHLKLHIPNGSNGRTEGNGRSGTRWTLVGGNARTTIQAEYVPGAETVVERTTIQSPLATISRLHRGAGGGIAWILLSDSFALGMIALGFSGLVMWSRGRTPRQMILSIFGAALVVVVLIGASAIL